MSRFHCRRLALAALAAAVAATLAAAPRIAAAGAMGADASPAHFTPVRKAYTTNHDFLVKLVSLPQPIPYQQYFTIGIAVYDGHHPAQPLRDAKLSLFSGMRHGLKHGFAHGMDSTPKILDHDGVFRIEGMYFHMLGTWTLKLTVSGGGKTGVAYFDLPCCGQ